MAPSKDDKEFACPFYKRNPDAHANCLHDKLHSISAVRKHIINEHSKPDYYCARCFIIFKSADERDQHVFIMSCEMRAVQEFEGISPATKTALNKNAKGKTEYEQWKAMWDLFPDQCPTHVHFRRRRENEAATDGGVELL